MSSDRRLLERKHLYSGRVIQVQIDKIVLPSGSEAIREVVLHPGGAVALAIRENGNILFVRQPRYPLGQDLNLLELPAGKLDPGEDPAVSVARELEEETGFRARTIRPLCSFYTSPGFCNELLHLYLAEDLSPTQQNLEHDEQILVEQYSMSEALQMIRDGRIRDAKTIVGLLWGKSLL